MTDERTSGDRAPEVEQQLARTLDPERHRAPSEGVPQGPPDAEAHEQPPTA